jgi:hypothetical protein
MSAFGLVNHYFTTRKIVVNSVRRGNVRTCVQGNVGG